MKRICSWILLAGLFLLLVIPSAFAAEDTAYVLDQGNLLTAEEHTALESQAQRLSDRNACGFYVLTVDSLDGKSAPDYAEDYSDENYLGYGGTDDCILLVVCLPEREFGFTGTGVGYYVLTDDIKADLEDMLIDGLGAGQYSQSFSSFLDTCAGYVPEARQYQQEPTYDEPTNIMIQPERISKNATDRTIVGIVAALGFGCLFALIPIAIMKRKNCNIAKKSSAAVYTAGSANFTVAEDIYTRTDTTRVRIENDSNRFNGGSTGVGGGHITSHTSSSGVSHSSGGGRF